MQDSQLGLNGVHYREVPLYISLAVRAFLPYAALAIGQLCIS